MSTLSITANTNAVVLTSPFYNPVTIAPHVTINNGSGAAIASFLTTYWTIDNSGVVVGDVAGNDAISLAGGGSVVNNTNGTIEGYTAGISMTGSGSVSNHGVIVASENASSGGGYGYSYSVSAGFQPLSAGVLLGAGGVSNAAGGAIYSYLEGVALVGAGTVSNAGIIYASNAAHGFGVVLAAGGSVSNTGTITGGNNGVLALGAAASVTNQGVITGSGNFGVFLGQGGTAGNAAKASITGKGSGVKIFISAGTVTNSGTITGQNQYGVLLAAGGEVTNASGGTITGAASGVRSYGTYDGLAVTNAAGATITGGKYGVSSNNLSVELANAGVITGTSLVGASLLAPANLSNAASGVITGGHDAVITGGTAASTIVNDGTLIGSDDIGVYLTSGGNVTNDTHATIVGYDIGIYAKSGLSTVVNDGTVTGTVGVGAWLNAGGHANNESAGTITGGYFGVRITNDTGSVVNAGSIGASHIKNGAAVQLQAGGTVSNSSGGHINAKWIGVQIGSTTTDVGGTVFNAGTIYASDGTNGAAVWIHGPAAIYNQPKGTIIGGPYAIVAYEQTTISNQGSIGGTEFGVLAQAGVTLSNAAGALMEGGYFGIRVLNALALVDNAGTIASYGTSGVAAFQGSAGAVITNESTGLISAKYIGVQIGHFSTTNASGTLVNGNYGGLVYNQGVIKINGSATDSAGVWLHGSGQVSNAVSGTISGGVVGIEAYYQTTVINLGTISGSTFAFQAATPGFADLIVDHPNAVFSGTVQASGTVAGTSTYSTLELASGTSAGTITGFGTSFVNFGKIALDAGASWTLGGTVAASQIIAFGGAGSALTLTNPADMAGTISGFVKSDTVVLTGITDVTGLLPGSNNTLTVEESSGPGITLHFAAANAFAFSVAGGATDITVSCFAEGTRIETSRGLVAVEALRVGSQVRSLFAGTTEVVWIGHRRVDCAHHPRPESVWPVHISANAFGRGQPAVEVRLSPDHAVYVNEVLIPVRYLINGTTVRQVSVDSVTYYHVELPQHDVLMAEGLAAESYLDSGDRSSFANGGVAVALFADFGARMWEMAGCAPLVVTGSELEKVQCALASRARVAQGTRVPRRPRRSVPAEIVTLHAP